MPQSSDNLLVSRFAVPGIKCAGCIGKIERGLLENPQVCAARVNFSTKTVAVTHGHDWTENHVKNAIEAIGFPAQILADNPLAKDKAENKKLVRALAVAGFGMMNIMLLSVSIWAGASDQTKNLFQWISAFIALPVIAYAGRPFFNSALMALSHRRSNMDVPISLGILLASALSIYETVTQGEHAYFKSVVMLIFFLLSGRVLDSMMRERARAGIGALLKQQADGATVLDEEGVTQWTKAADILPGMMLQLAAGENLAVDGEIIKGESRFDFSHLTGESAPQLARAGDFLPSGIINMDAPVIVKAKAKASDSSIAEMARLMDEAGQHRSQYVRIADKAASLYAPIVHGLALLAFLGWMMAGVGWHQALLISVSVLIITCPCALGLAVPAAQVVASGTLMRHGVLIKDGSALERLANVDFAYLDKTGTLTMGRPVPQNLQNLNDEQQAIALSLAQQSRHPLSKAIAKALSDKGVKTVELDNIREISGEGVFAHYQDGEVALQKPMQKPEEASENSAEFMSSQLRINGQYHDIFFTDPMRPDVAETIKKLSELDVYSQIVSGDNEQAVSKVAHELGLKSFAAQKPEDKMMLIAVAQEYDHKVLMVGDGLNDGPALAAADIAIAPSSASDVGQQAADMVFTSDSLMPIAIAVKMARKTMANVQQNFALASIYNILAVPLALAGMVTPLLAAIAMSISSLIVVGNALRLYRVKV